MEDSGRPDSDSYRIRLARSRGGEELNFRLEPDAPARKAIAQELDLIAVRKLRFVVRLIPDGKTDWRLDGQLGATVVQPCVSTLVPVTTRINAPVLRRYLADLPQPEGGDEVEMPDDDSIEPLPAELDLNAVLVEELALNLPLYPHADGAAPVEETFAGPGATPITEQETKPFAGLASLRDKLKNADE